MRNQNPIYDPQIYGLVTESGQEPNDSICRSLHPESAVTAIKRSYYFDIAPKNQTAIDSKSSDPVRVTLLVQRPGMGEMDGCIFEPLQVEGLALKSSFLSV